MIAFRHPSRRRLESWTDRPDPRLDAHIETCHRCANRLEEMATPTPTVTAALERVLEVPDDLAPRVAEGIARKMQARAELALAAEMLGLPLRVVRLMGDGGDEDGS